MSKAGSSSSADPQQQQAATDSHDDDPLCLTCWRYLHQCGAKRPMFKCAHCSAHHHLKCDTAAVNLVTPRTGLLVSTAGDLPRMKYHFNWCHLCQRIDNRHANLIISYSNFAGCKTTLKHSLLTMLSFIDRQPLVSSDVLQIARQLHENVVSEKYRYPEECLADLLGFAMAFSADLPHQSDNTYTVLAELRSLLRMVQKELNEMEHCYKCYNEKRDASNSFLEPCNIPHSVIWVSLVNYSYWPAKLIWVNDKQACTRSFPDGTWNIVPVNKVYTFSKNYPGSIKQSINVLDSDLSALLSAGSTHSKELPDSIKSHMKPLQAALDAAKAYLKACDQQFGAVGSKIPSESVAITAQNFKDYSHVSLLSRRGAPKLYNGFSVNMADFALKEVEPFSIRAKLDLVPAGWELPADAAKKGSHAQGGGAKLNGNSSSSALKSAANRKPKSQPSNMDHHDDAPSPKRRYGASTLPNIRIFDSNRSVSSVDSNYGRFQTIDSSKFENDIRDIYNFALDEHHLLRSNSRALPGSSRAAAGGGQIEALTADFVNELRSSLMNAISTHVDSFCFQIVKSVSSALSSAEQEAAGQNNPTREDLTENGAHNNLKSSSSQNNYASRSR